MNEYIEVYGASLVGIYWDIKGINLLGFYYAIYNVRLLLCTDIEQGSM